MKGFTKVICVVLLFGLAVGDGGGSLGGSSMIQLRRVERQFRYRLSSLIRACCNYTHFTGASSLKHIDHGLRPYDVSDVRLEWHLQFLKAHAGILTGCEIMFLDADSSMANWRHLQNLF